MKIFKKGFTLIELIIVIAILGILAAALLAALDPLQQIKRAQDGTSRNAVGEVVGASQRYYAQKQQYAWAANASDPIQELVDSGELKQKPTGVTLDGASGLACFAVTSKALLLDANTKYSDSTGGTSCTGAGTSASKCTYYCLDAK